MNDATKPSFEQPAKCAECDSETSMQFLQVSKDGKDNVPAWVCDDCGHAHFETTTPATIKILVSVSTSKVGSKVEREFEIEGYATDEEIEEAARDLLFDRLIQWDWKKRS